MQSAAVRKRTQQVESLASAPILKSRSPALHNTWPRAFCSPRQAPWSCVQPQNEHLLSTHHGVPLRLRPALLPGFALRVENDVTHSKHSSVTQSTRGQNRLLRPAKIGKVRRMADISNRELTMRRASASRLPRAHFEKGASAPRRTPRGICSALSNRELSTIVSDGSHSHKLEIIRTGEFLRG
jgi:hypothetical protein